MRQWPLSLFLVSFVAIAARAQGPSRFATQVVQVRQGSGSGIFIPANTLGHPRGAGLFSGSTNVLSLGDGGDVTLGFSVLIADGPGVDFLVFENAFLVGDLRSYSEPFFVEVSTDGVRFARFPTRYGGPAVAPGPFDPFAVGTYAGFGGGHAILANDLLRPEIDPFDPCTAGGEGFDLSVLRTHPLVVSGAVQLMAIQYVRLVDVVSGVDQDSNGRTVYAVAGSADVDAVAVVHHQGNLQPSGPRTAFTRLPDGRLSLRVEDPDGIQDLDGTSLRGAILGIPLTFDVLLSLMPPSAVDANGFTLTTTVPLPAGFLFTLSASVRDLGGAFSADQYFGQ
jgi:hypothetical protein